MSGWDELDVENNVDSEELEKLEAIANGEMEPDDQYDQAEMDISEQEDMDPEIMELLSGEQDLVENATFRLEQGRIYEMLMKHDLFEGVQVDKRASAKVNAEIKSFVMERLEILLGIKAEKERKTEVNFKVKLPFNQMEIDAIKDMAFKLTKGKSGSLEEIEAVVEKEELEVLKPKVRMAPISRPAPVKPQMQQIQRPKPQQRAMAPMSQPKQQLQRRPQPKPKAPEKKFASVSEMSEQDLIQRNALTPKVARGTPARIQPIPMPDGDSMVGAYSSRIAARNEGNMIANILGSVAIETVDNN